MYGNGFTSATVTFKNNIFANLGNGTSTYGGAYRQSVTTSTASDYNDMYVLSGGTIATLGATNYTTLLGAGSWNAATSFDANSYITNPGFTSAPTSLGISDACLRGTNASALGITTDILGTTR